MFVLPLRDVVRCTVCLLGCLSLAGLAGCASGGWVTAEATLAVSPMQPDRRAEAVAEPVDVEGLLPKIHTELHTLASDLVVDDVLASDAVRATDWYRQFGGDRVAARRDARQNVLAASHVPDTLCIRLTATTALEEDALALLQAWTEAYLQHYETRAESRYHDDRRAYQHQYEAILSQIEANRARLEARQREQTPPGWRDRQEAATQELMFLNAKQAEIVELLSAAQASRNHMLSRLQEGDYEPTAEERRVIEESQSMLQFDAQLEALRKQREAMLAGGAEETGAAVRNIDAQTRNVELEREQELDNQARVLFNAKVELAAQAVRVYQEQLASFEPRVEELRARVADYQRIMEEHETIVRNIEVLEVRREQARAMLRNMEVLIRRSGAVRVELLSPPALVRP